MASEPPPHRRLRLVLDLEADDLAELSAALTRIGNDLEYEGREQREVTSGGYGSGWHLTLTRDEFMDHDRFATEIAEWHDRRKAASRD